MPFYAKYPSTTTATAGTSTVQGPGTAGTPVGGVLSIQGVSGGQAVPISGSITATNPSVGATGATIPASATYLGGLNGGNLVGVSVDSSGNPIVVGSGVAGTPAGGVVSIQGVGGGTAMPVSGTVAATQSGTWNITNVSGTVSLPTGASTETTLSALNGKFGSLGQKTMAGSAPVVIASDQSAVPVSGTVAISGTVAATQSGTWNIGTVTTLTGITNALPAGGNTIGAVTGSGTFTTNQTTAAVTWQTEGSIAFGSLTTSFATAFTVGGSLVWVGLRNNTDGTVVVSLDSGTTSAFTLDPGDQVSLDLKPQGKSIAAAVTIQAKYTGTAPTVGTFRVNGYY